MESSYLGPTAPIAAIRSSSLVEDDPMQGGVSPYTPTLAAHQGSGSTKDNSDQNLSIPDMGSRWCPDEIEIFFECKFCHLLNSKLVLRFPKIRM